MKKTGKRIIAAGMALMLACSVPGNVTVANAATLTAKQYLVKMQKAQKKVKSYEMKNAVKMEMSVAGESSSVKATSSQIVFTKPVKVKSVTKTTVTQGEQSETQTTKTYMKESKGKINEFTSTDGSAYAKTTIEKEAVNNMIGIIDVQTFSNAKIVKDNVTVDGKKTIQISVEFTGADMEKTVKKLLKESDVTAEEMEEILSSIDFSSFAPIKTTYWIDRKTYLPVKTTVNAAGFITDIFNFFLNTYLQEKINAAGNITGDYDGMTDFSIDVSKGTMTTTYKNYNNAKKFSYPKVCK